jgi:hypothetical protein
MVAGDAASADATPDIADAGSTDGEGDEPDGSDGSDGTDDTNDDTDVADDANTDRAPDGTAVDVFHDAAPNDGGPGDSADDRIVIDAPDSAARR